MRPIPDELVVRVGPSHIKRGKRGDCQSCPIALAICGALHIDEFDISVDDKYIDLLISDVVYALPSEASHFVDDFDAGKSRASFVPFTFTAVRRP